MAPKRNKLEPKLPRGFADRGPADIRAVERMMRKIKAVYERYGFEPVETPFVEYTEALGKFLPDQDRPNEGVFSFQDDDESWLSLRYDLTAPLARYVAENFDTLPKPYRSYRAGWVFRNEKPGPGRFRQFMQFDADTVGTARDGVASAAADAEICMMVVDVFRELGFERGQYVVRVNSRKILDGLMELMGLAGTEHEGQRLTVLRAIDKRDKFPLAEVEKLLGAGRLDESGDFTKGAGLNEEQIALIRPILTYTPGAVAIEGQTPDSPVFSSADGDKGRTAPDESRHVAAVGEVNAKALGYLRAVFFPSGGDQSVNLSSHEGYFRLQEMAQLLHAAGYSDDVIIDPSVVRGLEYYTGPVFEAQLNIPVTNERNESVVFGSVGGGGRYDGLVARFRGEDVPATGFSVGVSRLAAALKAVGKLGDEEFSGPVVVTVMDREKLGDYQAMVADLRNAGVAAEMYLGGSGMKAQLKYADRRNAPAAIIAGSDEFASGKLQIKDLAVGKAKATAIGSNQEWREERPGQFEIPRGELVARVKELLAKQRGK